MIKTFIIAALSADGFIAQNPSIPSTRWTSKEDTQKFVELTKRAGVVIMGSKTFETFGKPLKDRKNIVLSRDVTKKYEGVETTQESPQALITRLEQEGFKEVAICGGASIYSLFLETGLVDTVYLTIENIFFGKGISLFSKNHDTKLKLVEHTRLGENALLLEYQVLK